MKVFLRRFLVEICANNLKFLYANTPSLAKVKLVKLHYKRWIKVMKSKKNLWSNVRGGRGGRYTFLIRQIFKAFFIMASTDISHLFFTHVFTAGVKYP